MVGSTKLEGQTTVLVTILAGSDLGFTCRLQCWLRRPNASGNRQWTDLTVTPSSSRRDACHGFGETFVSLKSPDCPVSSGVKWIKSKTGYWTTTTCNTHTTIRTSISYLSCSMSVQPTTIFDRQCSAAGAEKVQHEDDDGRTWAATL
jgi:hypothetical protein